MNDAQRISIELAEHGLTTEEATQPLRGRPGKEQRKVREALARVVRAMREAGWTLERIGTALKDAGEAESLPHPETIRRLDETGRKLPEKHRWLVDEMDEDGNLPEDDPDPLDEALEAGAHEFDILS
jgi:hypothetical protein